MRVIWIQQIPDRVEIQQKIVGVMKTKQRATGMQRQPWHKEREKEMRLVKNCCARYVNIEMTVAMDL